MGNRIDEVVESNNGDVTGLRVRVSVFMGGEQAGGRKTKNIRELTVDTMSVIMKEGEL